LDVGYEKDTHVECYRTKGEDPDICEIVCQAYAPNILSGHLPRQITYQDKILFLYEGNFHQHYEPWYVGYYEKDSKIVFFKHDGYNVANAYAELLIELSENGLLNR